jgi:hypothetical protein
MIRIFPPGTTNEVGGQGFGGQGPPSVPIQGTGAPKTRLGIGKTQSANVIMVSDVVFILCVFGIVLCHAA